MLNTRNVLKYTYMNPQVFKNAYDLCVKQPDKYPSKNFKKFVGKLFPQKFSGNPLRTAMITGYFLRCAECVIGQSLLREPDQSIQKIISSDKNEEEKIETIAGHLDNQDRIGLSDEIANYVLIPFQNMQRFFEIYAEDFINQTLSQRRLSKENAEAFYELAYRNMAFGYLYKLSEEFVESASDPRA
jgi:hypothetical protein